jgi:hypothetical protein
LTLYSLVLSVPVCNRTNNTLMALGSTAAMPYTRVFLIKLFAVLKTLV